MADSLPCPFCHQEISLSFYEKHLAAEGGRLGGKSRSAAKRSASRENGQKLGRPKVQASEHQLLQRQLLSLERLELVGQRGVARQIKLTNRGGLG